MSKMSNGHGWQLDRATAERLANELGWRIGQALDGGKLLYRPGLPEPIPCRSWLAMATYMIDYIERRRLKAQPADVQAARPVQQTTLAQPISVAQHAPSAARVTRLGQVMRRAGPEDAYLPHGKIL